MSAGPLILSWYIIGAVVIAVVVGVQAGPGAAFYALASSTLLGLAGGGVRRATPYARAETPGRATDMRLGSVATAILTAGLGWWLASRYSVRLGVDIPGWVWGWLGFVAGFIGFR